ncbi:MAG: hypothetical protein PWQ27_1111 [Kosmotoga sp.]|nr:hypothetical protein [Kosmotoga sp.]
MTVFTHSEGVHTPDVVRRTPSAAGPTHTKRAHQLHSGPLGSRTLDSYQEFVTIPKGFASAAKQPSRASALGFFACCAPTITIPDLGYRVLYSICKPSWTQSSTSVEGACQLRSSSNQPQSGSKHPKAALTPSIICVSESRHSDAAASYISPQILHLYHRKIPRFFLPFPKLLYLNQRLLVNHPHILGR